MCVSTYITNIDGVPNSWGTLTENCFRDELYRSRVAINPGFSSIFQSCKAKSNFVTHKSPVLYNSLKSPFAYHPTAPSGPPTDVVTTALSPTTVSVSWQPPALLDQNGVITAYQVVLVDTSDGSRKMSSVGGNTLTLLFEGMALWFETSGI